MNFDNIHHSGLTSIDSMAAGPSGKAAVTTLLDLSRDQHNFDSHL